MRFIAWIIVLCLAVTAPPASAEWFADVYGGQSLTEKNDLTVHNSAGLGIYRVKAPFIYTNQWGSAFALTLPLLPASRLAAFFAGLAALRAAGFFALREAAFFFDLAIKIKSRDALAARGERIIKNKSTVAQGKI